MRQNHHHRSRRRDKPVVVHQRLRRFQRLQRPVDLQPFRNSSRPLGSSGTVGTWAFVRPPTPLMNAKPLITTTWVNDFINRIGFASDSRDSRPRMASPRNDQRRQRPLHPPGGFNQEFREKPSVTEI